MAFSKITDEERLNKGNVGKPDTPGLSTTEMQELLDELPNLAIDGFNRFVDEISAQSGAANIGAEVPEGVTASPNVASILSGMAFILTLCNEARHGHLNKETIDQFTEEYKTTLDMLINNLNGMSVTNVINAASSQYQIPTAKSVFEYEREGGEYKALNEQIIDIENVYNAKNMIPYPFYETTKTESGITFTDNKDGTVTVNGTAAAQTTFWFAVNARFKKREYILSSAEALPDGLDLTFSESITLYRAVIYGGSLEKEITFELPYDITTAYIGIRVNAGATISNFTVKAMVRLSSVLNDTFVPYAATNKWLTDEVKKKTSKPTVFTDGNIPLFNSNGDLYDSGKSPDNYYTKTATDTLLAPKADETEVESLIKDTVGWTGKNLLQNTATSKTSGGITFTVNSDGSVTANGTATESVWLYITKTLPKGRYIISGCPSGGGTSGKYYVRIQAKSGGTPDVYDVGDGAEFEVTNETQEFYVYLAQIGNGYTANNLTFYPMIRRADISDSTYEPYHDSVEVMYEEEIHGVNLLKNTATTQTVSDVTFTVNADGTISANGTASADVDFNIIDSRTPISAVGMKSGDILSGCANGSDSTYWLSVLFFDSSSAYITGYRQYGDDLALNIPSNAVSFRVAIGIKSGYAASNLKFYPMLRKSDIEDSTYRPYNPQSIQHQLDAQGQLGAKNLLPNNATSQTINGVTFTVNADGSVTANGTASAAIPFNLSGNILDRLDPKQEYILSGCPKGGSASTYRIYAFYGPGNGNLGNDYGDGVRFSLSSTSVTYTAIKIYIFISSETVLNNLIFYPMLRLASDPDNTYQPYAMTNKELTDKLIPSVVSVDRDTTTTNSATIRLYRYGNLRILTGNFNPSVAGTSAANTHIADLPLATDRPTYSAIGTCGRGEQDSSSTAKIGNLNVGPDGTIKYQGQATGENMFFNISWLVGV